jgi:hypothetical protein
MKPCGWLLLLLLAGCGPAFSSPEPEPNKSAMKQERISFTGKIVFVPLEGGFYGIVGDDGQQYDPANLPEAFRQDGLRVEAEAIPLRGVIGYRMWGRKIELLSIEVKK